MRKDASNAVQWAETVSQAIKSGDKFSLAEARTKLEAGNRLKFTCSEYKDLKKALQTVKAWSKRVKKSGLDEGTAQIYKIKEFIREHDSFIISMPEEIDSLKQALCAYCICRRPYEGFMIGCDDCEEWYHGPCIGISQAQGNRIDKYLCVRCCVKKVYKNSCNAVASVIRKWCDPKEMAKSRSQDAQKHQRKIREKKREIVKWKEELQANVVELRELKSEEKKELNTNSDMPQAATIAQGDSSLSPKITEVNSNIVKATAALEQCNRRMEELAALGVKRKAIQDKEDAMEYSFRYWCLMLRTKVLTPETVELSEKSRPNPSITCKTGNALLSGPMLEVIESASKYGINKFPDAATVKDSLECISWCHFAFSILMRKPTIEEVKALIDLCNVIKLPEVKSIGMLRSMISRTSPWQARVNKALTPISGEKKTFSITALNELRVGLNAIPLTTPQEILLCHAIEDGGTRHCACGGPRDDKMECCNHCGKWYHMSCFFRTAQHQDNLLKCPFCQKLTDVKKNIVTDTVHDISPHAPDPLKLWPPFGLISNAEALKVLGTSPIALKIEKMQEPKPINPKGNFMVQNGCRSDLEPQLQYTSRASASVKNLGPTFSNAGSNNIPNSLDTKCNPSLITNYNTNLVANYEAKSFAMEPLHSNSPASGTAVSALKASMGAHAPIFGSSLGTNPSVVGGNSILDAEMVTEGAIKTALRVNMNPSLPHEKFAMDEAAGAAVKAALESSLLGTNKVTAHMYNGVANQPNNLFGIISNTKSTPVSVLDKKTTEGIKDTSAFKSDISDPSSIFSLQPHNSISNNSSASMNQVMEGNQAGNNTMELQGMNTASMAHHLSQDPPFITTNVIVTGQHTNNITHLVPQAATTAHVKTKPLVSVLLKKFG